METKSIQLYPYPILYHGDRFYKGTDPDPPPDSRIAYSHTQRITEQIRMAKRYTHCDIILAACGMEVEVVENSIVSLQGDKDHPPNLDELCGMPVYNAIPCAVVPEEG